LPAPLDLRGLNVVADLERSDLHYPASCRAPTPSSPDRELEGRATSSRRDRKQRRAAAPPLRLVLDVGAGLHRAGGRGPARAGDQADALPHLGRQPDRRGAHRRRRGRQAGAGARRDQGPLRRGGEHRVGAQARAGRRARRLRPRRPQDPLPSSAWWCARRPRAAPLLPHRHRQLQPEDGAPLRGPRPAHRRPEAGRRGPHPPLQPALRLRRRSRLKRLLVAPHGAHGADRAHRRRDRERHRRGASRRDPQGQLDRRRGSSSTRSTAPRRPACRRPVGARHLRAAPRASPACPTTSRCARSSAASSSTRASSVRGRRRPGGLSSAAPT
jgi:hypothetical protein